MTSRISPWELYRPEIDEQTKVLEIVPRELFGERRVVAFGRVPLSADDASHSVGERRDGHVIRTGVVERLAKESRSVRGVRRG